MAVPMRVAPAAPAAAYQAPFSGEMVTMPFTPLVCRGGETTWRRTSTCEGLMLLQLCC
jgi:hypothetical protein